MSDLVNALTTLGLRHTAAHLDDVIALATKRRWSTTQLLEHLAESEQQERTRRSRERRLLRSRLGRFTPMSNFDWAWPKRIDRPTVEATLRLDFLAGARNVVLVAPQGLGKTMIAQNIAHAAVLAGHHVLFKTAAELLLDLGAQESARGLGRRLNFYATRGLFVIDEIGYLSYGARAADLEEEVGGARVVGEIADLVDDEESTRGVVVEPPAEPARRLLRAQIEEEFGGGLEEYVVAGEDGGVGDVL